MRLEVACRFLADQATISQKLGKFTQFGLIRLFLIKRFPNQRPTINDQLLKSRIN